MSYENQLIREATGQGREFEMSRDETPPAQENIEPNETSNQQGEKFYDRYVCVKCGHVVITTDYPPQFKWTDGHICRFVIEED